MGDVTKVVKAHSKFNVLRTSIPSTIRNAMVLKEGDELEWQLVAKGGKIVVEVTKKK